MAARTSRARRFVESAELYDAIYHFKDYRRECERLRALIDEAAPAAGTILDVACGTGEHARFLKDHYSVDGVDINENYLRAARQKNPAGNYIRADMTDFDLGRTYDVVTCLFSAIGRVMTFRAARARDRLYGPSCQARRSAHRGALVHTRPVETWQSLPSRRGNWSYKGVSHEPE
jgi:SAM-dependent methyltransferase